MEIHKKPILPLPLAFAKRVVVWIILSYNFTTSKSITMGGVERENQQFYTIPEIAEKLGNRNKSIYEKINNATKRHPKIKPEKMSNNITRRKMLVYSQKDTIELISIINRQEFLTLSNGDEIPLLKGGKREEACGLFAQARDTDQPLSRQKLNKNLYPQDDPKTASLKLRSLLHKMKKEWQSKGWTIRHPEYIDRYGKTRKMRGFYELKKEEEQSTTRETIIMPMEQIPPPKRTVWFLPESAKTAKLRQSNTVLPSEKIPKKPSEMSVSKDALGLTESTSVPKPTQKTIWESPAKENVLNQRRKECIQNLTLSILSLLNLNDIDAMRKFVKDFKREPTQSLRDYVPKHVSFDSFLGINPDESKETKKTRTIEFFINGFIQTINTLWNQQSTLTPIDPMYYIERGIIEKCKELEQKGIEKNTVLTNVCNSFGVKITDEPEAMTA